MLKPADRSDHISTSDEGNAEPPEARQEDAPPPQKSEGDESLQNSQALLEPDAAGADVLPPASDVSLGTTTEDSSPPPCFNLTSLPDTETHAAKINPLPEPPQVTATEESESEPELEQKPDPEAECSQGKQNT